MLLSDRPIVGAFQSAGLRSRDDRDRVCFSPVRSVFRVSFPVAISPSLKEKTDYLMLEALKSREIDDMSHFIGTEHPIHCCFEELNSDVSSEFSPD
jgi:hypothetical protein